jgi:hypothetical protein
MVKTALRFAMSHVATVSFTRSHLVRSVRSKARAQPLLSSVGDDLRLFATTFGAGFLFVSLFLA